MVRLALAAMSLAAPGLAGCMMNGEPAEPAGVAGPMSASALVRDAAGQVKARATATQVGDSIRLAVEAMGMAPGAYGAHIHTTGRCDPPAFASAGGHWNPAMREHGKDNPAGMHMGDLPNLMVGTNGKGSFEVTIPHAWISGGPTPLLDADGAALVIHAQPDDYRTDPSGNSGARIACGVFG